MSRVGRRKELEWYDNNTRCRMVYKRPYHVDFIREKGKVYLRLDNSYKREVRSREEAITEVQMHACTCLINDGPKRYYRLLIKARKLRLPWSLDKDTVACSNLTLTKRY